MHPRKMHRGLFSHKAFTLVELLATTAIVSLLAALLLSGFKGVMSKSKEAQCVSNLRQIGLGMTEYAAENEGCLPSATITAGNYFGNTLLTANYMWCKQLGPYLPQKTSSLTAQVNRVFICAAATSPTAAVELSYTASATLYFFDDAHPNGVASDQPPRKLAGIENLSRTILVTEGRIPTSNIYGSCPSSVTWSQMQSDINKTKATETGYVDFRHGNNGKINALYADMHVDPILFKDRAKILRPNWEGRNYTN